MVLSVLILVLCLCYVPKPYFFSTNIFFIHFYSAHIMMCDRQSTKDRIQKETSNFQFLVLIADCTELVWFLDTGFTVLLNWPQTRGLR